jgi:hypothetical protein
MPVRSFWNARREVGERSSLSFVRLIGSILNRGFGSGVGMILYWIGWSVVLKGKGWIDLVGKTAPRKHVEDMEVERFIGNPSGRHDFRFYSCRHTDC